MCVHMVFRDEMAGGRHSDQSRHSNPFGTNSRWNHRILIENALPVYSNMMSCTSLKAFIRSSLNAVYSFTL